MPPKHVRYRLLLDEMLPRRQKFPSLNKLHNVRHIIHDMNLAGITDIQVIEIAKREKRIIVTKNIRHYRKSCETSNVLLIGISETIPPETLDQSLVSLLSKKPPSSTRPFVTIIRPPRMLER